MVPPGSGIGTRISRDKLDRELIKRGWTATDLARAAHISPTTVSGGRRGKRLMPRTLRRIALALLSAPVVDGLDELIELR